jgi:hypothetical protein
MVRMDSMTEIMLDWRLIADDRDTRWAYTRAVYAYLTPRGAEVLYIGKADGSFLRFFLGTTTRLEWTMRTRSLSQTPNEPARVAGSDARKELTN